MEASRRFHFSRITLDSLLGSNDHFIRMNSVKSSYTKETFSAPPNYYFNFGLPENTAIESPMTGYVMSIKRNLNPERLENEEVHDTNLIVIMKHKELITLTHLLASESLKIGSQIFEGQIIGKLYGWRDYSHLHLHSFSQRLGVEMPIGPKTPLPIVFSY